MTSYECPYCPEVWASQIRLMGHVDRTHREQEPNAFTRRAAVARACISDVTPQDLAKPTDAPKGRSDLSERLAAAGERLDRAGEEIRELKNMSGQVLRRLEALDVAAMNPALVRRATLNLVWDRLIDDGNIGGAQMVMRMIDDLNKGDWS
jgi:hypothetical protein